MFATRARRAVENARLSLDATKAKAKNNAGHGFNPDDEYMSEEMRAQIERKEDEFVGQTEEAVGVMKNVTCFLVPDSTAGPVLTVPDRSSIPRNHSGIWRI